MIPFGEILQRTFGAAPAPPPPAPAPVSPPPPPPKPRGKSIGDPRIAAEAQRIFNPALPPAPPKAPAAMADQGVAPAMGTSGPWGKPE
jgi:hypothetical protein